MSFLISNYNNPLLKKIYDNLKSNNKSINFLDENMSSKSIKNFILKNNINVIIHTDTIYDIDECEKLNSQAIIINKNITKTLVDICNNFNITLVYLSSQEVYGENNSEISSEISECNPANIIGKSQKICEDIISNSLEKFFILRLSWVFGTEKCYIKQIIRNVKTPLIFSSEKIINPTPINYIIDTILTITLTNKFGIYNCSTSNNCSKLEFTKFIFKIIAYPKEVLPFPNEILQKLTKTANNSALNTNLLKNTFGINIPNYETEVIKYINSNFN
ncbi:MAG: sugar nucleotide-binding protein [Sarcina sp.]